MGQYDDDDVFENGVLRDRARHRVRAASVLGERRA
jgi:hypothetical protein